MTRRGVVIMIVAAAILAGVGWDLRRDAPPSCTSEQVLNEVSTALHDRYQLDSIYLNDLQTVRGGWFSRRLECSAEEATIAGNENVSNLSWRAVHYRVVHLDGEPDFAVVADLGGPTPFVRQKLSFWERLIGGR